MDAPDTLTAGRRLPWHGGAALVLLALVSSLTGCQPAEEATLAPAPIRPVRVVAAEVLPGGEDVTLTGTVQAQDEVSLAFRVGGQLRERSVNVGDRVRAGQVVARLDASDARHALDAARANLASAMARLTEARNTVARYEPLLPRGFVSRVQFDRAVEVSVRFPGHRLCIHPLPRDRGPVP